STRTFTSIGTSTSTGTFTSIGTSTLTGAFTATTSSEEHTMATFGTAIAATFGMARGMDTASARAGSTLTACGSGTSRLALETLTTGIRRSADFQDRPSRL